jgi:magnesium transporter
MIRFDYHLPGTAPATLLHRQDSKETEVTLLSYNLQSCEEHTISSIEEIDQHFRKERINWINVEGLANLDFLRALADRFELHPLALEDALQIGQRPRIEPYGDMLFVISGMLYFESPTEIVSEQISIFAGKDVVITLQEGRGEDLFERIRNRIRAGTGYARKMQSDYLLYAILDALVDNNFPILEVIGDGLEELEGILLRQPTPSTLRKLYEVKRLLLQVRREIWPHREILAYLMRDETGF